MKISIKAALLGLACVLQLETQTSHRFTANLARTLRGAAPALSFVGIDSRLNQEKPALRAPKVAPLPEKSHIPTIFAHGLGGNAKQGDYYRTPQGFIQGTLHAENFDDHQNPSISCLGQEADCRKLHEANQHYPAAIFVGVSRGASAIINYLGQHQPSDVKAAVLESPFDHANTVARNQVSWLPISIARKAIPYIYKGYDPNGLHPIDMVSKISHETPILIVCSKEDALIPYTSSKALYDQLIKSGHKKAYLLVTEKGFHAHILWSRDGECYRNVVHAFYRAHGLPHDPTWAEAGQEQFSRCQPSPDICIKRHRG